MRVLLSTVLAGGWLLPTTVVSQDQQVVVQTSATLQANAATKAMGVLALPARLQVEGVPLAVALDRLQETSGVALAYSPTLLSREGTVTCLCAETTVDEAIRQLLLRTTFDYFVVGEQLVIRQRPLLAAADVLTELVAAFDSGDRSQDAETIRTVREQGTITGRVTDARTQRPLASVEVYIAGVGVGTLTQSDGRYLLPGVPTGTHTLSAQRIGYGATTHEVTVAEGETLVQDFSLAEEALGLDEIVVTGEAGAARRREVGNSITQINMRDVPEPTPTVESMLQGRAAGMSVAASGATLGGGMSIRLRGNTSFTMSNQPIVYVDGVRVRSEAYPRNAPDASLDFLGRSANVAASPLDDINPADIERIEVIKGAAATSLYGTEASSGVIQIFTKRGREGSTLWNLQIEQGFQHPLGWGPDHDPWMRMEPWLRGAPSFLSWIGFGGLQDKAESRFADEFFATASSGSEPVERATYDNAGGYPGCACRHRYYLSASGGVGDLAYFLSGSLQNNKGVLLQDEQSKYTLRGNVGFSPFDGLQIQWNTSFSQDNQEQTHQGGSVQGLNSNAYRGADYVGGYSWDNMNALTNQSITNGIGNITTSLNLSYQTSERFSNRLAIGVNRSVLELRTHRPFGFRWAPTGVLTQKTHLSEFYSIDYSATWSQGLSDELGVQLSFGGQAIDTREKTLEAFAQNFPGPGEPVLNSGGFSTSLEDRIRVITAGVFGQTRFDWRDRVFLTFGLRFDGNSAFGESLGLETYPKVSLSYVISDEQFWPTDFGSLKLRGAVGEAGRAPGAFDAVRTWNPVRYGNEPGFLPLNRGNPDLGPERTREYEVGFDASVFNDRLVANVTYYHQNVRGALFGVPRPASEGGWDAQLENVGEIENKGFEVELNATVLEGREYTWDVGMGIATNHNKLLDQGDRPDAGPLRVGFPVPAVTGTMILNRNEIADPVLVQDTVFGPNQPTTTLTPSMRLEFSNGIILSARGEYQGGFYMENSGWSAGATRSAAWPTCGEYIERLAAGDKEGIPAKFRAWCDYSGGIDTDMWVFDATFFKVRDITVQFPIQRFIPWGENATLALSAQNAIRWYNDDWLEQDPEQVQRTHAEQIRSVGIGTPPPATFLATLRVSF